MRISDWSSDVCSSDLRYDAIGGKAVVGPADRDADHDRLVVGDPRFRAHDRRMHDPLTVDHAAEAARPGGVDDRRRDRAAIEGRDVAADQHPVIGDDDAGGRIELTEAAKHPVGTLRLRSEEHTSELQSLMRISSAAFCLKQKKYYYSEPHT